MVGRKAKWKKNFGFCRTYLVVWNGVMYSGLSCAFNGIYAITIRRCTGSYSGGTECETKVSAAPAAHKIRSVDEVAGRLRSEEVAEVLL